MMMIPRSYVLQSRQRRPSPDRRADEKGMENVRTKSTGRSRTPQAMKRVKEEAKPAAPVRTVTEPAAVPSQPVVIPPRSLSSRSIPTQTQTLNTRGQHGGRRTRKSEDIHRPGSIPPAVAALLAVTSIPPPIPKSPRRGNSASRHVSIDALIQEWSREDAPSLLPSPGRAPIEILLEKAEESDSDSIFDVDTDAERECPSSRSVSSDSIPSIPSLLNDDRSVCSMSIPSTPPSVKRRLGNDRLAISPPSEECKDHPLLSPTTPSDDDEVEGLSEPESLPPRRRAEKQRSTLKSNLTASFNALKSAAKSFSNFTAPSIPPDDLLTRSLLSSQRFTSEMRPKPTQGVPGPALRRYLNPTSVSHSHTISSSPSAILDGAGQLHEALLWSVADTSYDDQPMIQMQTYDRTRRSVSGAGKKQQHGSSPFPPAPELGPDAPSIPAVRQREPRENSDFLRVIVLEMNMRREGKLDAKSAGRARIWLPPRKSGTREQSSSAVGVVPVRWMAVSVDDVEEEPILF